MLDPKYTKPVSSVISIAKEEDVPTFVSGTSLNFTLCDRTSTSNNRGNYFVSFNLPASASALTLNSSLSTLRPELQQLNSDKIIIMQIPNTAYSEYIDGRSVELSIPISLPSGIEYYKLYSSTYSSDTPLKEGEHSPLLGDNVAYLFCDNINRPYTGLTTNDLGQVFTQSAITTWNPNNNYLERPSAVSYLEVQGYVPGINSDRRMERHLNVGVPGGYPSYFGKSADFPETDFYGGDLALYVKHGHGFSVGDQITIDKDNYDVNYIHCGTANITDIFYNYTPPNYLSGEYDLIVTDKGFGVASYLESGAIFLGTGAYYNYDVPVGFVSLDKGFVVITHKEIVDKFSWSAGTAADGSGMSSSPTDGEKNNVHFTSPDVFLNFVDVNKKFIHSIVCMALGGEFYISNNSTWNRSAAISQFANNTPVQISEMGLYNELGELLAIAKFSEPVEKKQGDIMSFTIDIEM